MGLSPEEWLEIRRQWPTRLPPSGSERGLKGCEAGRTKRRTHQTCRVPHLPPFVCDPSSGALARHPNHSGTDGPLGSQHHHDLHPRPQARPNGRHQPSRPGVAADTSRYRVRQPLFTMDTIAQKRLLQLEFNLLGEGGSRKTAEPAWWFTETIHFALD